MNALIIDIRETCLRAVLSNEGVIEYCRTFDFTPQTSAQDIDREQHGMYIPARDNPYLIYYDLKESGSVQNTELKQIIKDIRADVEGGIDSVHLIVPTSDVIIDTHKLPKLPRPDIEKLIARKVSAESKEEFPPFSIIPGEADQKNQTWFSVYVPSTTIQGYKRLFANNRMRLTSITTPVNAMLDAFKGVREAIFNAHAVFEIQRGFIEAYYISSEGILHFERMQYLPSSSTHVQGDEDIAKLQKHRLFKIIDTVFRINSHYQGVAPQIPVQMAWICGDEDNLDEVATALKEAMSVEVGIAPAIPTGAKDESAYVPLAGFASSIQSGTATTYSPADFLKKFPLRRTSGIAIYALTFLAAGLAFTSKEKEYRTLRAKVPNTAASTTKYVKGNGDQTKIRRLDTLKKLTAQQYNFYSLLRDLANSLPEGIALENIEFRQNDNSGSIDLIAFAYLSDKRPADKLLSNFMQMVDSSPELKKHREPSISYITKDKRRILKISLTCEVTAVDTKK